MTQLANTFEGGTDGAGTTGTITTGNSGGANGDAFDLVSIPASATVAYSGAQAKRGSLSAQFATAGTSGLTAVTWSTSRGSLVDDYVRAYWYCTNLPTVNGAQVRWYSGALAAMGSLTWNSTGNWVISNAAGATVATSSTTVAAGQWCRIEAHKFADVAAGFITCRIFKGANLEGATADEEFGTANTWADPTATSARVDIGMPGSGGANQPGGGSFFIDDPIVGASAFPGPSATPDASVPANLRHLGFGPF